MLQQAGCAYRAISADLRDSATVLAALSEAGIDTTLPTLFVSEVVTAYVEGQAVAALDQALLERYKAIILYCACCWLIVALDYCTG